MSKHNWTEQKQIRILDEEKMIFDAVWEAYIQNETKQTKQAVEDVIEYLATQYDFNPKDFTVYDKQGKLIHRRLPRNTSVTEGSS